jgi:hypothetical protein
VRQPNDVTHDDTSNFARVRRRLRRGGLRHPDPLPGGSAMNRSLLIAAVFCLFAFKTSAADKPNIVLTVVGIPFLDD